MGKGTPSQRFWAKVNTDGPVPEVRPDLGPCWLWTACTYLGYGIFAPHPKRRLAAHRYAYELLCGPIPTGLHIDHLCRVRGCVNPDHLEPVTLAENNRRQAPFGKKRRTHCKRGLHAMTDANRTTGRACRECEKARRRQMSTPRRHCPAGHPYPTATTTPGRHRRCYVCRPLSDRERRLIAQGKSPKTGKAAA